VLPPAREAISFWEEGNRHNVQVNCICYCYPATISFYIHFKNYC
jgi:hypothetical protein